MSVEIEYKYLVSNEEYRNHIAESHQIKQGYLSRGKGRTVRVRICDNSAFLTIKGANVGAARLEFEYSIPVADAESLLGLCPSPVIVKTRHIVFFGGHRWEVDEFHGDLQGLTLAEIELPSIDTKYQIPPFVGKDVTNDPRYYNSRLTSLDAIGHQREAKCAESK